MLLRTEPINVNEIADKEIEYLFNIIEARNVNTCLLGILRDIIDKNGELDFSDCIFYELGILLNYMRKKNYDETKLFEYIRKNIHILPRSKYIRINISSINKSYYLITTLPYDSIRRCNKIKLDNAEYFLAEYDESGRFGKQYIFYPERYYKSSCDIYGRLLSPWISRNGEVDENQLPYFRAIIEYSEIVYYFMLINTFYLCCDIMQYIKQIYCKDIDLSYFTDIVIV